MSIVLDRRSERIADCHRLPTSSGFDLPVVTPSFETGVSTELFYFVPQSGVEAASAEANRFPHDLKRMCQLTDDWDSAGALAPATEIIADACEWLERMSLLDDGATLPDSIAPGVNGEIVFYWQRPGLFLEATIDRPRHVEWMVRLNDRVRHFESGTDIAVVIDV